jgi:nucleoside-diphosphate-sugar epimerase
MHAGDKDQYGTFINICMVHVDDVARAHIFLLESSTAKGRYICSSDLLTNEQMPEFLSARYPEFQIPTPE